MDMVISGFCGALASVMGKITFSPKFPLVVEIADIVRHYTNLEVAHTDSVNLAVRIAFGGLMFYFNILMIAKFLKALESYGSLPVTVACMGVNFVCTGLLGSVVLGENVNSTWCLGAVLIIGGVLLVLRSTKPTSKK